MNDIEEKFYKTFGIEKQQTCSRSDTCYNGSVWNDCQGCNAYKYPQITDRILLELICILNKFNGDVECCTFLTGNNIEELKKSIFQECFDINSYIREQVRSLFEGVEE